MGNCSVVIKKAAPGVAAAGLAKVIDISMSASYATGGDTLTPAQCGLKNIDAVILAGASPTSGVVLAPVQPTSFGGNVLMKAYQDVTPAATAPLPEVAAATNLSTHTVRALVIGDNPHV